MAKLDNQRFDFHTMAEIGAGTAFGIVIAGVVLGAAGFFGLKLTASGIRRVTR